MMRGMPGGTAALVIMLSACQANIAPESSAPGRMIVYFQQPQDEQGARALIKELEALVGSSLEYLRPLAVRGHLLLTGPDTDLDQLGELLGQHPAVSAAEADGRRRAR